MLSKKKAAVLAALFYKIDGVYNSLTNKISIPFIPAGNKANKF
jgi:hypothetical protein